MITIRLTQKILLALACCLALAVAPLSVGAQSLGGIVKKGAKGVQKGVETGAEKTKEGAEAVGHAVKKAVTGDDTSSSERMKSTETNSTTESQTTTTREKSGAAARTASSAAGEKKLPATAGEFPLLALVGSLALAASGVSRLIRRGRL